MSAYRENSALNCVGCGRSLDATTSGCGQCLRRRLREATIASGITIKKVNRITCTIALYAIGISVGLLIRAVWVGLRTPPVAPPVKPPVGISVVGTPAPGQILVSNGSSLEPRWITLDGDICISGTLKDPRP